MNDLSIEYFYKKFEFRAGRINLISDFFFVWVGLPLLVLVLVACPRKKYFFLKNNYFEILNGQLSVKLLN